MLFARIIILNSDCAIAYNDIHYARARIRHVRMEPKLNKQTLFPRGHAIKRLGTRLFVPFPLRERLREYGCTRLGGLKGGISHSRQDLAESCKPDRFHCSV